MQVVHVGFNDLLSSIRMVLIGNASPLYWWNPTDETFVLAHVAEGKRGVILVDGRDDVLTERYTSSFCLTAEAEMQNTASCGVSSPSEHTSEE